MMQDSGGIWDRKADTETGRQSVTSGGGLRGLSGARLLVICWHVGQGAGHFLICKHSRNTSKMRVEPRGKILSSSTWGRGGGMSPRVEA